MLIHLFGRRTGIFTSALVLWLSVSVPLFAAGDRYALVVGIDNYENVSSLQKANNDAVAVSHALERIGFQVTQLIDSDRREFNRTISGFASNIRPGDEIVFYFAGHGIEVDGRNYLLPADVPFAAPGDEDFIISESIPVDWVLSILKGQGSRVTLLILDACRNNPFPAEGQRSLGGTRGLARMDPPEGSFILFSAGTGQTALDRLSNSDPNPNSVFTRALLPRLQEPGLAIHDLVQRVRADVRELAATVQHNQFPAYYDQLSGQFSFNPENTSLSEPAEPSVAPQEQVIIPQPNDPCEAARADWQIVSTIQSLSALEEFLRKYASCSIYVAAAKDRIATLSASRNQATVVPQTPTAPSGGDICTRLWYERNLIFHNKGYCFQTARAKAVFDISQCTGRSPSLSSSEQRDVERIRSAERANGC